jgi:hypothetical protein
MSQRRSTEFRSQTFGVYLQRDHISHPYRETETERERNYGKNDTSENSSSWGNILYETGHSITLPCEQK